jgi:hypothetical protein
MSMLAFSAPSDKRDREHHHKLVRLRHATRRKPLLLARG